ncbi:MAG: hypothetical protein A2381_01680 [Bdellovibrionales bacterium RIFOXYB1_FULL_37_110]|nr:MAG: hypothetical protein A2417_15835 [Bdellovibrionales bacterium RIFOXYC1_FULL_37_79]OFZ58926.1 MAG: hypothetical protein A2381_01680 [Bdellovibrionales bacterium RIFOXYB1_FULL_37_110]OFZ64628.1 MAG: hypothetical protein A2577_13255 [Bdellovibrionales bacterium RIFOXYD1_FULL_36_51]
MNNHNLPLSVKLKIYIKSKLAYVWSKYHVAPRYYIVIPIEVTINKKNEKFHASIINISRTGVFIETNQKLPKGTVITLHFTFQQEEYCLPVKQISDHTIINSNGIGAKFISDKFHGDPTEAVNQLIETISNMVPPVPVQGS